MLVYNNREGHDAELLARFAEPSWNNPVMRFLNASGEDILPRKDRLWTRHAVAQRLVQVLNEAGRPAPRWLELAQEELAPGPRQTLTFAMHCYWVGEVKLGALDGVLATRAGWYDGEEVVEVEYDPQRVTAKKLVAKAKQLECASTVWAHDDGQAKALGLPKIDGRARDTQPSEQWYRLRRTPLRLLPMTPLQATRVNAAIGAGTRDDADGVLSPRQQALARKLEDTWAKHRERLEGLEPPRSIDALDEYLAKLQKTLGD